jgi:hypothetical protein
MPFMPGSHILEASLLRIWFLNKGILFGFGGSGSR